MSSQTVLCTVANGKRESKCNDLSQQSVLQPFPAQSSLLTQAKMIKQSSSVTLFTMAILESILNSTKTVASTVMTTVTTRTAGPREGGCEISAMVLKHNGREEREAGNVILLGRMSMEYGEAGRNIQQRDR